MVGAGIISGAIGDSRFRRDLAFSIHAPHAGRDGRPVSDGRYILV